MLVVRRPLSMRYTMREELCFPVLLLIAFLLPSLLARYFWAASFLVVRACGKSESGDQRYISLIMQFHT